MSNVADIADYRPHYTIQTHDEVFHVVPKQCIDDISSGKITFNQVSNDMHDVIRRIINEWQGFVDEQQPSLN